MQPAEPPAEFLARMCELLGPQEFPAFRDAFEQRPYAGLRVNTLKISIPDFISIAPFSLAPIGDWEPAGFIVTDDSRPGRHPYHDAGLYYLQEPSAMAAAAILSAAPGERVLDLAAAPGGKATQLAALMGGPAPAAPVSALRRALDEEGLLVANDVHAGRARLLADNLARWGALNVLVTQDEPQRVASAFGPVFDRVLIDAPCSGEGMIRRRESLEWSEAIVAACARRQRGILAVAPELVRPGGQLLYATCTFAPEENEQVVAGFLAERPDFQLNDPPRAAAFERGRPEWAAAPPDIAGQLARAVRLWPHRFPGEGHFLALLRRETREVAPAEDPGRAPLRPPSAEEMKLWRAFADASLAVDIPDERLHAHNGRLYLRPKTDLPTGRIRLVRCGLLLGEVRPGRFHPAHDLALALAAADAAQSFDRPPDHPQLVGYLSGAGLSENGPDGWVLVTVGGFGLGWGKRVGGRIKNHYPPYLRRR
ncbi:MAG: RsmF rRNA methyltransferase first C-terminal domain-containing protein [Candidatus Promineofilum sp.]|nr:RsmF rRNA methyltransferase first C-terminal domain-containing protein [Promineifilum sp.]